MTNIRFPIVVRLTENDKIIARESFLENLLDEIESLWSMHRFPSKKRGMKKVEFSIATSKARSLFRSCAKNTISDYFEALHISIRLDDEIDLLMKKSKGDEK